MSLNPPSKQVEELFDEARHFADAGERKAFLDRACTVPPTPKLASFPENTPPLKNPPIPPPNPLANPALRL